MRIYYTFPMSQWTHYAVSVPDTIYGANIVKTSHNPVRRKGEKESLTEV